MITQCVLALNRTGCYVAVPGAYVTIDHASLGTIRFSGSLFPLLLVHCYDLLLVVAECVDSALLPPDRGFSAHIKLSRVARPIFKKNASSLRRGRADSSSVPAATAY